MYEIPERFLRNNERSLPAVNSDMEMANSSVYSVIGEKGIRRATVIKRFCIHNHDQTGQNTSTGD